MSTQTKSNSNLLKLIEDLKRKSYEQKINTWKALADDLSSPSRKRRVVNLYKLSKFVGENETAIVPGKVLAAGELDKKITIAAYSFSREALVKINKTGKAITIEELMLKNPKAENVRIIG